MPPMAGVTAHLAERGYFLRYKQGPRAGARGSEGRFRAGVAAADNNDIVFRVCGHWSINEQLSGRLF